MGISRNTVKQYLSRAAPVRVETAPRARPVWEKVGALAIAAIVVFLSEREKRRARVASGAPRRLRSTIPGEAPLAMALRAVAPQRLVLVVNQDVEMHEGIGRDLFIAISNAGWTTYRSTAETLPDFVGIRVEIAAGATTAEKAAAKLLVQWLRSEQLSVDGPIKSRAL
jgi:hypothetical protein